MSVLIKIFSLLGTVLILVAGFILPDVVSVYQDQEARINATRYDLAPVQINTAAETDIFAVMKLVESGSFASINLSEGENLGTEEVLVAAQEFLNLFSESGVSDFAGNNYGSPKITPFLAMGDSGDEAVILWNCEFIGEEKGQETIYMVVDDASGKVVSFRYSNSKNSTDVVDTNTWSENVSILAEVCSGYYGLDVVETEEAPLYISEASDYWETSIDLSKEADQVVRITHVVYFQNYSSALSDGASDAVESDMVMESLVSISGIVDA